MSARRGGFTLIEVLVLVVVIGIAAAGVLLVFQNTVRKSADPQIYKQALAIAEAMLDEVLLTAYDHDGVVGTRAQFNDVQDFHGFLTVGGFTDIQGAPVPGLADYNVAVSVANATVDDQNAGLLDVTESRRVTVTVTHGPSGISVALDGYRMRYAP
jgi:MSHA pilin protein MshD